MATLRSALFVDFDNVFFSLRNTDEAAARAFANDPGLWLDGLISGKLIEEAEGEAVPRRILVRRCYANPSVMRYFRSAFLRSGFQIIDCPSLTGRGKNSADISMVIDALETVDHATHFDEFIILSGDADFTPLVTKLRTHDRRSVIYCNAITASAYRALCDGMVTEDGLLTVMSESPMAAEAPRAVGPRGEVARPAPARNETARAPRAEAPPRKASRVVRRPATAVEPEPETAPAPVVAILDPTPAPAEDPASVAAVAGPQDMETVARRIAQATGAPLLSPADYAALFRAIAVEVGENGYAFRRTVDGVMERLEEAGIRLRPQAVAFVLKGLTMGAHRLEPSETAGDYAKIFRRQVHFLATSRGLEIDSHERLMIGAWIVGGLKSGPQSEQARDFAEEPSEPSDAELAAESAVDYEAEPDLDTMAGEQPQVTAEESRQQLRRRATDITSLLARIRGQDR